ncbi:MAG: ribonuclease III [Calothrix sp. MO_192.B10]|nr:ribonuclease III [Calothrix sp. MO_192.B10]
MHQLLRFRNQELLRHALTHRSYANENPQAKEHNERLEFLGDALLNFLSGEYLYNCYPEKEEDELTRRRSALVDEVQLAQFAIEVGVHEKMLLGKGAILEGGYENPNLLSSTFEALIGAYYLDNNSDIAAVRAIIQPLFESVSEHITSRSNLDIKNQFQEWAQRHISPTPPKYVTLQVGGVSHSPVFLAKVLVNGKLFGEGRGSNKKEAEKAAAKDALGKIKKQDIS